MGEYIENGVGSWVKVNGFLGEFVVQARGVRQGCPLSPVLYVLYLEPLVAAIRACGRVRGLWLPGSGGAEVKVAAYADDMTLFLSSERSADAAMEEVSNFAKASGSAVNRGKCRVKFFGTWVGRGVQFCGMEVCEGP